MTTTTKPAPAAAVTAAPAPPPTANLFALAGEAFHLEARISEAAEGLVSDDPDVIAQATEQLEALLAAAEGNTKALQQKADAYCWVIDRMRAQATARAEHAKRLQELAKADEQRAQALQDKLVAQLLFLEPDATTFSLPNHEIRSRRSTVVEIDEDIDPLDLEDELVTIRTSRTFNKTAIREAIQSGQEVEGARIVERRSWRIG